MSNPQDLFQESDGLATFIEDPKPWEQERPIDQVESKVQARRLRLPLHMSPKLQFAIVFTGVVSGVVLLLWLFGFFNRPEQATATPEQVKIEALTKKLQDLEDQEAQWQQKVGEKTLTANLTEFNQKKQQQQRLNKLLAAKNKAKSAPKPVQPKNTVQMPKRTSNVSPPRSLMVRRPVSRPATRPSPPPQKIAATKPSKPSLDSCIEYLERDVSVPECASYQISKKKAETEPMVKSSSTPAVRSVTKKPLKLAFAGDSQTQSKAKAKAKPDYQVNYMAGEIQTVDQFEDEFYGSGQSASAPQLSSMKAKVIDHIEWLSPEDAQQIIIPLQITSGPNKGQTAEAKITEMNGVQFTAQVISLNGKEVEPGKLELRRKNTKYLRAEVKRQGGENFGKRLLGTVAAIGGEVASDQLANVRGGSHISRLVPGQSRGQAVTQFWRFDGEVEIVPVN